MTREAKGRRAPRAASRPAGLVVSLGGVSPVPLGMEAGLSAIMSTAVRAGDVYGLVVAVLHPGAEDGPIWGGEPEPGQRRRLMWTISQVLPGKAVLARKAMRLLGEGLRHRRGG